MAPKISKSLAEARSLALATTVSGLKMNRSFSKQAVLQTANFFTIVYGELYTT